MPDSLVDRLSHDSSLMWIATFFDRSTAGLNQATGVNWLCVITRSIVIATSVGAFRSSLGPSHHLVRTTRIEILN